MTLKTFPRFHEIEHRYGGTRVSTYKFGADLAVAASLPKLDVLGREKVRVGVLTPLTGDSSAWGRPGVEGCKIWADRINAQGGLKIGNQRRLVEIVAFDDERDPARALVGAKHLVLEQNAKIIMMLGGDIVPAVSNFLTRSKMLATTMLPSDLSPDTPYLIAPCEVHPIYVTTGVNWLAQNRPELKTVAMCAQKDAIGLPSAATYRAAFEAAGIRVVRDIMYTESAQNMVGIVDAMLANEPDILCWTTSYEPFVHALTEIAFKRGFKGQILSCTCDNYPELIGKTSREFMEGLLFQFPDFDDPALEALDIGFDNPAAFYHEFNQRFPASGVLFHGSTAPFSRCGVGRLSASRLSNLCLYCQRSNKVATVSMCLAMPVGGAVSCSVLKTPLSDRGPWFRSRMERPELSR